MGLILSSHYSKCVGYASDSEGGDEKDVKRGVTVTEKDGSTDSLTHCRVRH